jgi:hypothetical protein
VCFWLSSSDNLRLHFLFSYRIWLFCWH